MVDETVKMISICGFEGMLPMHEWLSGGVSPCQGEGRGFESRLVLFLFAEKDKKSLKARDSLRPRRADAQVRMPSLRPLLWAALGQTLPSRAF